MASAPVQTLRVCVHSYSTCILTFNVLMRVSPLCSVEDAAGGLRSEIRRAGGEEDEQLLHHGADVGGRHQRQGEI